MGIPLIHFIFLLGQMTLFFPQNFFSPNLFKRVEVAAEQPLGNDASHVSCTTSAHHCTRRVEFMLQQPRRALAHEYDYYADKVTIAGAYNEVTIRHIRTARHEHSPPHTLHKHTAPYTMD